MEPAHDGVSSSALHFRSGCLFLVLATLLVFAGAMYWPRTPDGYLLPISPLLIVGGVVMLICVLLGSVQIVRAFLRFMHSRHKNRPS